MLASTKVFVAASAALFVAGCASGNDQALRARVNELQREVSELRAEVHGRSSCRHAVDVSVPSGVHFDHDVAVSPTESSLAGGDAIAITSVKSTRSDLAPGSYYVVKGRYTLASADRATLGLFVTNLTSRGVCTESHGQNRLAVKRGTGSFALTARFPYPGRPHVTFYVDGQAHGGVYFASR